MSNKTQRDWTAYEAKAVMRGNHILYISPDIRVKRKQWHSVKPLAEF